MAKRGELPDFHTKRKALFDPRATPQRLRETGEMFHAAERYDDALEFFSRCEAQDAVRAIAETAMKAGNVPLFMRARRILREAITENEWTQIARRAEEAGAFSMACVAHCKAGHEDEADRLRRLMSGPEEEPVGGKTPFAGDRAAR
ncbi:MAG: hypothetical protein GXY85_12265 [Candidatus Brocadiaceae bacterium]|nr:hypothetical protein [Candidatus Brocadiaceae bacterium]